jgi:copper(I)-binding protein
MNRLLGFYIALSMLAACAVPASSGSQIRVEKAWARPTAAGSMADMSATPSMPGMAGSDTTSAAYFMIVNKGGAADTLMGVASNVASTAEMHETQIVGDVAKMVPVARVDIPAHGQFEFKPEGYHVMLMGLSRELKAGDTISLTLQFAKSGAITLAVPIRMEP